MPQNYRNVERLTGRVLNEAWRNSLAYKLDSQKVSGSNTYGEIWGWKALNPSSRVLLENLTVAQLVKNSPVFYGNGRFFRVFRIVRYWFLSWTRWMQYTFSQPTSLTSILILSCHLRLQVPKFWFSDWNVESSSHFSHAYHLFRHITLIWIPW
jgi:hypothetical protein